MTRNNYDDMWRPGDGYFPVSGEENQLGKKITKIPVTHPEESNCNPVYHDYLDKLERVNKEHEFRRIAREAVKNYPDSEAVNPNQKTLASYQEFVRSVTNPTILNADHTLRCQIAALGLCGESGEVADLIKKHVEQGHPFKLAKIIEELGDVMFYIASMCNANNISLNEIMDVNVAKLQERYPAGFSTDASINRKQK